MSVHPPAACTTANVLSFDETFAGLLSFYSHAHIASCLLISSLVKASQQGACTNHGTPCAVHGPNYLTLTGDYVRVMYLQTWMHVRPASTLEKINIQSKKHGHARITIPIRALYGHLFLEELKAVCVPRTQHHTDNGPEFNVLDLLSVFRIVFQNASTHTRFSVTCRLRQLTDDSRGEYVSRK